MPLARTVLTSRTRSRLTLGLVLGVGWLSALFACGSRDATDRAEIPADEVVPRGAPPPPRRPSLFDADGRLLPSERALGGLLLPVGLENEQSGAQRHLFEAPVPAAKLVQYFGPRLLTGRVEPSGTGASFLGATPLRPAGTPFRMDVMITERGQHRSALIIRLIDVPTPRPRPPTDDDLRTHHERLD